MEIDVTHMVEDSDEMFYLSGSRVEHGQDAGQITWRNSIKYGQHWPLLKTDDERDAARQHFREYGAWSQEEIDAWSEEELQGIMCQDVASAIREAGDLLNPTNHEKYMLACESGRIGGRLSRGGDDNWYFYLGV